MWRSVCGNDGNKAKMKSFLHALGEAQDLMKYVKITILIDVKIFKHNSIDILKNE